jgi:hypothetical protein
VTRLATILLLVGLAHLAGGQPAGRVARVGTLALGGQERGIESQGPARVREELVELGWLEGWNLVILLSYAAYLGALHRRAAVYVDKLLKGARAADLPVEQPTKFELIVDLKTAKALGLTIQQPILVRRKIHHTRVPSSSAASATPSCPARTAFARPEDVILSKLAYFQQGGSERHLRDVAGMLRISGEQIDMRYVDEWARRLALTEIWEIVRGRAADADQDGGRD